MYLKPWQAAGHLDISIYLVCNNIIVNFSEQALTANMQSNEQSLNLRTLRSHASDATEVLVLLFWEEGM